ncbi:malonyl-ACP O-methyltransferase BioC [Microbulbifer rhizosphaerae]|uniref:Malonyl-[acyl-carrier protein] O-methyltransferase n=1 Tax=Microbulbifer rhizosphaerae TaxID=1562603 RepID=A0A7W4WEA7_9GAMM|nr:malonyl-CoA O-methyltransferase [Microbulbifer rhizosphaerae]
MKPVERLILVHGWGGDSRGWQPLLDALRERTALPITCLDLPGFGDAAGESWPDDETLLQNLYRRLPHNCLLVGHSLGGMLAARLAALPGQEKISALLTIAANGRFVAGDSWPGMDPAAFRRFCRSMRNEPRETWEKFCGLQARGDGEMRRVIRQLKQWAPQAIGDAWGEALDCLGRWDNREILRGLSLPALHLLGECDALVPADAAARLRGLGGLGTQAELLPGSGHAPQLSNPERVAEKILGFVRADNGFAPPDGDIPPPFDKSAVAKSFGRAAHNYDNAAHLQRAVCRQLLREVGDHATPRRILDLGSGTGYGSGLLRRRFPGAEIIALDLAGEMLQFARRERPAADHYIAADAEQLPLADGSIDLVFSSMALQWCYRLPQLFAELRRILAPGGRCLVATLGPGTLRELKASWADVDGGVHVNRFLPEDDWRRAAGDCRLHCEERVLYFDSARLLMRELKVIGARNINRDAGRGLLGREKLRRLAAAYERFRTPAGLPATYEVIYLEMAGRDAAPTAQSCES